MYTNLYSHNNILDALAVFSSLVRKAVSSTSHFSTSSSEMSSVTKQSTILQSMISLHASSPEEASNS